MSLIAVLGATLVFAPDVVADDLDRFVSPGHDFFAHTNGRWLKRNPIPASESGWGIGSVVQEELYARLRKVNESAVAERAARGTDSQKIADFWSTAMDETLANRLGLWPLDPYLKAIDGITTRGAFVKQAFALQEIGVSGLFGMCVQADAKRSDRNALQIVQAGIGMPEREYYLAKDKSTTKVRQGYAKFLGQALSHVGRPSGNAGSVLTFETRLARGMRSLAALRDPDANYHRYEPRDLESRVTPSLRWREAFAGWKTKPSYVVVGQPDYLQAMDRAVRETPLETLKDYLRVRLIAEFAPSLSREIDRDHFSFYGTILSGRRTPQPRWKRVLRAQDGAIGYLLGKAFVSEYFPPAAKARYTRMVEAVRSAYRARIARLDWMSPATKKRAFEKLNAMTAKVGYPDKWKSYAKLSIGNESYAANMMQVARWEFRDELDKVGKPVDKTEWEMTPQTYNAYYNPTVNEIVLPAAIFTIPGYRDEEIDDAVAYGYAGASTIGHEITHGFDDEGRHYDAKGNLKDWWAPSDAAQFKQRASQMVRQFNAYEPLPGVHINGEASLGENLADFGGIVLGLDAFCATERAQRGVIIAGLTPVQRFFHGYAIGWRYTEREASLRMQLMSDVHSPAKWRVNGPLSNVPDFLAAFNVLPGQRMWRPVQDRVRLW